MGVLLIILLCLASAWYWLDSMRAREIACALCEQACAGAGVQFLDETVALKRLWLRRDREGRLRLCRRYGFEFSITGESRRAGFVMLCGTELEALHLDLGDRIQ